LRRAGKGKGLVDNNAIKIAVLNLLPDSLVGEAAKPVSDDGKLVNLAGNYDGKAGGWVGGKIGSEVGGADYVSAAAKGKKLGTKGKFVLAGDHEDDCTRVGLRGRAWRGLWRGGA